VPEGRVPELFVPVVAMQQRIPCQCHPRSRVQVSAHLQSTIIYRQAAVRGDFPRRSCRDWDPSPRPARRPAGYGLCRSLVGRYSPAAVPGRWLWLVRRAPRWRRAALQGRLQGARLVVLLLSCVGGWHEPYLLQSFSCRAALPAFPGRGDCPGQVCCGHAAPDCA
jgi:hypothetical protein